MVYQDPRYSDPEYGTKWRKAHPEVTRERSRRYLDDPAHREANRLRAAANYAANRDARLAQQKAYHAANRAEIADRNRVRKYGLTADELAASRTRQDGRCAICRADCPLSIDHNHTTGAVRGLLCATCNFLIGHGKDDPVILRAAAAYLENE